MKAMIKGKMLAREQVTKVDVKKIRTGGTRVQKGGED